MEDVKANDLNTIHMWQVYVDITLQSCSEIHIIFYFWGLKMENIMTFFWANKTGNMYVT
jgi:hypothetical protein